MLDGCDGFDDDDDGQVDEDGTWLDLDFDDPVDDSVISINGDAEQIFYSGAYGYIRLTPEEGGQAGTAFLVERVSSERWTASFLFNFDDDHDGSADGISLAFLEESDPTLVGGSGGSLGVGGLSGYAITLDSHHNSDNGDPSDSFIGLVRTEDMQVLDFQELSREQLVDRDYQELTVVMDAGNVKVYLGEVLYLNHDIQGYDASEVMLGLTAGTGGQSDTHGVDEFSVCQE